MTTSSYIVTWAFDVEDCANPRQAAHLARAAQTRPGTTAVVFDVKDVTSGTVIRVDLNGTAANDYVVQEALPGEEPS